MGAHMAFTHCRRMGSEIIKNGGGIKRAHCANADESLNEHSATELLERRHSEGHTNKECLPIGVENRSSRVTLREFRRQLKKREARCWRKRREGHTNREAKQGAGLPS